MLDIYNIFAVLEHKKWNFIFVLFFNIIQYRVDKIVEKN